MLDEMEDGKSSREDLITEIDIKMRYYASADITYVWRRRVGTKDPGVPASEMIRDVCNKLKVKFGASIETMLERLVNTVVENELKKKSPEDLEEFFEAGGLDIKKQELILESIKKNSKVAILPLLQQVLGPQKTQALIEMAIIYMLAPFIGREAVKALLRELAKRLSIPGIPILTWTISILWTLVDFQGPAFRKTIPFCLYLGLVEHRIDGDEDK